LTRELRAAAAHGQPALAWAAGNALGVVADDSCYTDIVDVSRDASLGPARQMVVARALARMSQPEATTVLLALLDDPDVSGHAIAGLAGRRDERARPAFERYANDNRAWVRKEAEKGLARLDR
jgi:HEAT repeat protein